ncbi:unannotated protein [freshwater metagenome]|uniref:Unannotated protein n=1 Tax=freshwater metagenome TaxID=449393 RepID=A0A6J6SS18_9ZZZZ
MGPDERLEQCHLQRVGVLVFVDEDRPNLAVQRTPALRSAGPQHRPVEKLGVVDDILEDHDLALLTGEDAEGLPRRPTRPSADPLELSRFNAELLRPRKHRADFVGEPEGVQGPGKVIRPGDRPIVDRPEQQIADPDILLGARQEPWWLAILLSRAVLEGEPVGKGMEG